MANIPVEFRPEFALDSNFKLVASQFTDLAQHIMPRWIVTSKTSTPDGTGYERFFTRQALLEFVTTGTVQGLINSPQAAENKHGVIIERSRVVGIEGVRKDQTVYRPAVVLKTIGMDIRISQCIEAGNANRDLLHIASRFRRDVNGCDLLRPQIFARINEVIAKYWLEEC
jgi:hypothetical protein